MRLVVLPQAIRRMVPPFMNQSIIQLKNTSLVSTIAVPDLDAEGEWEGVRRKYWVLKEYRLPTCSFIG